MFQPRPAEELYDTWTDPYEIKNLAGDPNYESELKRLRRVLDRWLHEVGDMGRISEADMVRSWYPNNKQPITAAPMFIPICEENFGIEPVREGGRFKHPVLIQIYCPTQGASIAYTFEETENPRWLLYTKPLRLSKGKTILRAKAVRIGFKESPETKATFIVE